MKRNNSATFYLTQYLINFMAIIAILFSSPIFAEKLAIQLADNHPTQHTVVKGDTLWDISAKFLSKPWQWPEIWEVNPQVANPHLIYPGDIIYLVYIDGKPVLQRRKGSSGGRPTFKLSPHKRIEKLDLAIPTIRLEHLAPFLTENRIVGPDTLKISPYILGTAEDHLIAAAGYSVYVKNIPSDAQQVRYGIYRHGRTLKDPDDKEKVLGFEAVYLGEGDVIRTSKTKEKIATLKLNKSKAEILNGARLLPLDNENFNSNFLPKAAQTAKVGQVLAQLTPGVSPNLAHVAATDVVIINFGLEDKIAVGDVFNIYRKGKTLFDSFNENKAIKLPNELAGDLLVFRVFDKVSYATIMDSKHEINIGDIVVSPYMNQH